MMDIVFKDDIRAILLALCHANLQNGVDGEYCRGYEAALTGVALAVGLADLVSHGCCCRDRQAVLSIEAAPANEFGKF